MVTIHTHQPEQFHDSTYTNVFPADVYVLPTSPGYNYESGQLVALRPFFAFAVRACEDACLSLYPVAQRPMEDNIEVCFERDGVTYIEEKFMGGHRVEMNDTSLLNCSAYRSLWLSWEGGRVKAGTGRLMERDVVVLEPSRKPRVHFISMTSGVNATWRLNRYEREYMRCACMC